MEQRKLLSDVFVAEAGTSDETVHECPAVGGDDGDEVVTLDQVFSEPSGGE